MTDWLTISVLFNRQVMGPTHSFNCFCTFPVSPFCPINFFFPLVACMMFTTPICYCQHIFFSLSILYSSGIFHIAVFSPPQTLLWLPKVVLRPISFGWQAPFFALAIAAHWLLLSILWQNQLNRFPVTLDPTAHSETLVLYHSQLYLFRSFSLAVHFTIDSIEQLYWKKKKTAQKFHWVSWYLGLSC